MSRWKSVTNILLHCYKDITCHVAGENCTHVITSTQCDWLYIIVDLIILVEHNVARNNSISNNRNIDRDVNVCLLYARVILIQRSHQHSVTLV